MTRKYRYYTEVDDVVHELLTEFCLWDDESEVYNIVSGVKYLSDEDKVFLRLHLGKLLTILYHHADENVSAIAREFKGWMREKGLG